MKRDEEISLVKDIIGLIIIIFLTWFFAGLPLEEKVFPSVYNKAVETCSNNGGLKYYEYDRDSKGDAYCNNGAVFEIWQGVE